jgi:hypothetical protein
MLWKIATSEIKYHIQKTVAPFECVIYSLYLQVGTDNFEKLSLDYHRCGIFIVAPCILKIHQLLRTNKCTTMYCIYSKIRIKTLKISYMFRSIDHHQGAHVVPC